MNDPLRLLLAFLFILPATLVAQPGYETMPPSLVQNLDRIPNASVKTLSKERYQSSYSLDAITTPSEAKLRADDFGTLPAANDLNKVNTER